MCVVEESRGLDAARPMLMSDRALYHNKGNVALYCPLGINESLGLGNITYDALVFVWCCPKGPWWRMCVRLGVGVLTCAYGTVE